MFPFFLIDEIEIDFYNNMSHKTISPMKAGATFVWISTILLSPVIVDVNLSFPKSRA